MIGEIRSLCRRLLEEGTVQAIIGYGQVSGAVTAHPLIITRAAHVDALVWNSTCYHNLVAYLTRAEVKSLGRAAVVVKACDERALIVLQRESQIDREQLYVIGVSCDAEHIPGEEKCAACTTKVPRYADVVVGSVDRLPAGQGSRYEALDRFLEKSPAERMEYWQRANCSVVPSAMPAARSARSAIANAASSIKINPSASILRPRSKEILPGILRGPFTWPDVASAVMRARELARPASSCGCSI